MTLAARAAISGLVALAVAMGIGRFAFTPLLPMMQHDHGLTLAQGGWLASSNYAGYLAGALYAMRSRLRPHVAIAGSLLLISLSTMAAAFTARIDVLHLLRYAPGFASALVLVFVSAWSIELLAKARRAELGALVFSGVGVGIVCAGLLCLVLVSMSASSESAWIALGAIAFAASAAIVPTIWRTREAVREDAKPAPSGSFAGHWRLIYAQAAFGFGYIIPATFLPVMAKRALGDTPLFGWAWPVFGAAAAASTLLYARVAGRFSVRGAWAASLLLMAAGVACPVVMPGIAGIVVAAVAVGSTFMVGTMLAMQEARRAAGERARSLMGAMTTAFALGQIAGPLMAAAATRHHAGFAAVLVMAALPLLLAAHFLRQRR
jgi:predicted MFS family arabinose efflux permease